jgi:hypothetical protein
MAVKTETRNSFECKTPSEPIINPPPKKIITRERKNAEVLILCNLRILAPLPRHH